MSETATRQQTDAPGQIILAGVVFVVSVAAFVALSLADKPTETLMLLCGPAVGALIVSAQVQHSTRQQNRQLSSIEKQTNGTLSVKDAKIDDLTHRLLEATARAEAAEAKAAATDTATPVT